jgi:hypothetical protein
MPVLEACSLGNKACRTCKSVAIVASKLMNRYPSGNQSCALYTEDLWYLATDMADAGTSLVSLFNEIMATNQSIAAGMSSFVTVLSSMAYYDQIA